MSNHDLGSLFIAVMICVVASLAAIKIFYQIKLAGEQARRLRLLITTISGGLGVWATHFITVLMYGNDNLNEYGTSRLLISMAAAIFLVGIGMAASLPARGLRSVFLGGGIIGASVAAMHYTGITRLDAQDQPARDALLIAVSLVVGVGFGAMVYCMTSVRWKRANFLIGVSLLVAVVASHRLIAMGAPAILSPSALSVLNSVVPPAAVIMTVMLLSLFILTVAILSLWSDLRNRRQENLEIERMRGLANVATEGLVICDGTNILTANDSFLVLSGHEGSPYSDIRIDQIFKDPVHSEDFAQNHAGIFETLLLPREGCPIPVEIVLKTIDFVGHSSKAIAVRDLRDRDTAAASIHHLAHHDALTGLPNRRSFTNKLRQDIAALDIESGHCLALLYLDLDRFKEVNDLFGHAAGDTMLQKIAKHAGSVLSNNQMLARLGGDEFAIIAPDLIDPMAASLVAQNVIDLLQTENETADSGGFISMSIGIAIYPNDATSEEALLVHADTALHRAKTEGRGGYRFFEAAMGAAANERRKIEHELRHAIAKRQLSLVYQPQKALSDGEIVGFEALLRWHHPDRGEISPALFIPIAEENGSIGQIGEWVLRQACLTAAAWKKPLIIAVNVSAVQLRDPTFAGNVQNILMETGLPPAHLELEITETALIKDRASALQTLRKLKALGVKIAMDDFGTGYSSLSNLRSFPFDKIKIDKSFVKSVNKNKQSATIVKAVIGLGNGLGLPVLAEGIETREEMEFLTRELCQGGQGNYLGRPARIEQFNLETGSSKTTGH
ncbi:bifunctional diguanylate cyclase/phosphodiesterase [Phyllobacterium sp. 628]|uniref:putative bifunctional diguanylate cyclase/phosphodiesterase n=1 Tax=Phyllobacterium sp. 628 TaxID=2718938 RepID=UPI001FCEF66D|nr:EAL domain-containing protein [Phyllobacterium sp. 628]